jgi:Beta-lactamase
MDASPNRPEEGESATHSYPPIDDLDLKATVAQILDCWPCGGLAVGVIADGGLAWFHGHGVADVGAKAPITEDTVFRIGSITKTFTAIAVMQLWERGLVDLDAPANNYLRSFRLVPVQPHLRPATCDSSSHILPGWVTCGGSRTCFSRPSVLASERHDRERRPLRSATAVACPLRLSRGRSGRTATMGSLRSDRSLRTSAASPWTTISATTSLIPWK